MKINRDTDSNSSREDRDVFQNEVPASPRRAYDVEQDPVEMEEEEDEEEGDAPRRRFPVALIVLLLFLALVAFGAVQVFNLYSELDGRTEQGAEQVFTVQQGSSVTAIATQLEEQGIIDHDWLFKLYAKYSGRASNLQYGDFQLRPGMSYNDILAALSIQQVRRQTVTVTIPEGTTAVAIAQIFVNNGLAGSVEEFLACANGEDGSDFSQYAFWNQIPDNDGRLLKCEGYLFPDTYEFYADATVYDVVNTLYKEFDKKTAGLMDSLDEKGMTLDEVVILASFIQEEAGLASEDYKVSAVFHNRLESDDPNWIEHKLESNASSYIMNDSDNNYLWNSPIAEYLGWVESGAIPEEVLAAYDTYRIGGLPAGAISNPGFAALDAALNPDQSFMEEGYYFFVTGSPTSEHPGEYFYAKTANEHYQNCVVAGWA